MRLPSIRGFASAIVCGAIIVSCTVIVGCASRPTPARHSGYELVRPATAADLRIVLSTIRQGPDGYPQVSVLVQNIRDDSVIIPYGPSSVIVHAGSFVQTGRDGSFALRRQILRPQEVAALDPPNGTWRLTASDGRPELMMPTQMPAGRYNVWATFRVSLQNDAVVQSDHAEYDCGGN